MQCAVAEVCAAPSAFYLLMFRCFFSVSLPRFVAITHQRKAYIQGSIVLRIPLNRSWSEKREHRNLRGGAKTPLVAVSHFVTSPNADHFLRARR